ncbi:hypothetical protein PF010_g11450 [Phytophthora fragariae]|uniref:USP domain-containing protein n=1 Tax=Phytophthora fragariae TaxID=53985 RepID=A0A6G0L5W5_9STRA|nr:hypothetical protein PF010_g11450 [Phytophthora fragariae]
MALPAPKVEMTPASSPMSMDMDGGAGGVVTPEPAVDSHTSKLENVKYLDEYKRTAALAFSHLLEIGSMNDSVWETTGGKMHVALDKSFVGEYIRGTYVEKDGKLSGLARLTEDGAWKLDGRFKKTTQSQSNACTLYWDKAASRFDGKWYRGDGSGDWKCLASPYASDFCGLAPTDPDKKQSELQPFYAGMVNMKQNLTNVCYQNSFLQTLYMTQDFRRLILSCDAQNYFAPYANSGAVSSGNVVGTIQDLFAQMTASQRPYLATHALQRCLPAEFKNGRQQDTSDFAHFLIDSLSQQLSQHENTTDDIASIFGGHQATILACKTCGKKSVNREYFWELLLNMIDLRYTPITSISAVSGSSMDIHTPEGYERLNSDLNKDRTGAPYVYLCVKRCPERATSDTSMEDDSERIMPITELVVKVALSTDPKPSLPGFERVDLDLNVGGGATASGKKQVYLFFRREPNGSPITDLQVIFGNESIPDGFKQIQVDLNQGDGSKVYLCYRCDMPITDLKIVNSGIPGYRMVEHLLNVSHEDAVKQYLALKTASPHTLYLAVKREETPTEGYITDVCVIYGEIDAVPDHYTCIQTTPAGHSANLNDGTTGVPVFICFRRSGSDAAVDSESTPSAGSKSLMDLALMWTSGAQPDTLPTGYTKIQHTPLGMEANLNQGTSGVAIHICYSKCDVKDIVKPLENALNGEYEITSSPLPAFGRFLSLSVVEELEEVRTVEGNFGIVLHSQLIGSMSGLLVTSKHQQSGDKKNRTIAGVWRIESPMAGGVGASMSDFLLSSYPFELTLNESGTEMDGWWSGAEGAPGSVTKPAVSVVTPSSGSTATNAASASTPVVIGGKWKIIKDSYVHVAFKKDYSTEWQDGQLVFSERVWRHDIESMLSRFVATRTLGGDNALSCSVCERKTESRTHTVIFEPPEHLIITLKRMSYDWNQQKACKCLHDVSFPAFLTLPSLTAEEELAVYDSANGDSTRAKQQNQSRHYGLYGVLVHSGLTANSGHYYSFCRESDESTRQLHLEDSTLSPWIKFNDTKVERSNWKEINRLVASTVSDTVYLLLYKKLSYELTPSHGDGDQSAEAVSSDDEEAMLLAKAMALSMSAAKQNQSRQIEEETKDDADVPNNVESEDSTVLSTSGVTKALLKKVEEENTAYLQDSLAATSSALHADDLHTLLVLRHSLPLHRSEASKIHDVH